MGMRRSTQMLILGIAIFVVGAGVILVSFGGSGGRSSSRLDSVKSVGFGVTFTSGGLNSGIGLGNGTGGRFNSTRGASNFGGGGVGNGFGGGSAMGFQCVTSSTSLRGTGGTNVTG